jgi:hypothetical protein
MKYAHGHMRKQSTIRAYAIEHHPILAVLKRKRNHQRLNIQVLRCLDARLGHVMTIPETNHITISSPTAIAG